MNEQINEIEWIQNWYLSQCDGDWEHSFAITITNLDNPGWQISIPLSETELELRFFDPIDLRRSEQDWVRCWTAMGWEIGGEQLGIPPRVQYFQALCGPQNLIESLKIFRQWATSRAVNS
ncbi:MAG TPA: immunity 53 family protein [Abditibacteriaceae bacterium]|jgi:hypothetical protein